MCCQGCAAVAEMIHESGLSGYYRKRTATPNPVDKTRAAHTSLDANLYDDSLMQSQIVRELGDLACETEFIIHNMHCPACVWLIENKLKRLNNKISANVNYSSHKLTVRWRKSSVKLSDMVSAIESLGYGVSPFDRTAQATAIQNTQRDLLRRLGVAGIFGMQVMTLAVAQYASDWSYIAEQHGELFHRIGLLAILPILIYSAAPIFQGAVRDLRQLSATMDVPIALGLLIAFAASAYAVFTNRGEVYFDSIAMFVFLQLGARYLEHSAHQRMTQTIDRIAFASPITANRLENENDLSSAETVPVARLELGDHLLVRPGETVPADGVIVNGTSNIDESVISGESTPLARSVGDTVIGGSNNLSNTVVIKVIHIGIDSVLANIVRLMNQEAATKPQFVRLTDRIAGSFSLGVLFIAACVAFFWWYADSPLWISFTISVLVVACPCALSLAVPTALAVAVNSLVHQGVLVTRVAGLQALANADVFLFDKTGTLTCGKPELRSVQTFGNHSNSEALQIAAAIARGSEHPIACAIARSCSSNNKLKVLHVINEPGLGIQSMIDGKYYYLGSKRYIESKVSNIGINLIHNQPGLVSYLADEKELIGIFNMEDPLRDNAKQVIKDIISTGAEVALVTGDRENEAKRIAASVGISKVSWECSPQDKLDYIHGYQQQNRCVAVMGDGINDAPVLAAANVSIAPANALQIVKINSDLILLSEQLELVNTARRSADITKRTIRLNALWAISYNLLGISLAAAGYVPPLVAAVGMSLSSLIVVCNSLRIGSSRNTNLNRPKT